MYKEWIVVVVIDWWDVFGLLSQAIGDDGCEGVVFKIIRDFPLVYLSAQKYNVYAQLVHNHTSKHASWGCLVGSQLN